MAAYTLYENRRAVIVGAIGIGGVVLAYGCARLIANLRLEEPLKQKEQPVPKDKPEATEQHGLRIEEKPEAPNLRVVR